VLTRLLEIYQGDGKAESQLTRFVNDLLGLDELEALLEGTHQLTDKRRLRHLLPEFALLEAARDAAQAELRQLRQRPQTLAVTRSRAAARLREILGELGAPSGTDEQVEPFLAQQSREAELVELTARRHEILAMELRAREMGDAPAAKELAILANAAKAAREATAAWRSTHGEALEDVLTSLRGRFPLLPHAATARDPAAVRENALDEVDGELARIRDVLAADAKCASGGRAA
jgi:exonuclease SbcC